MSLPASSPGTVSKILWHFTGGPQWSPRLKKQRLRPKPPKQAYDALKKILRSKMIRLGGYREIIRKQTPQKRRRKPDGTWETFYSDPVEHESLKVCCLADIPIQHLAYHARRYGRFAIGFHRAAVLDHDFNPVLYTPEHSFVIDDLYQGLTGVNEIETQMALGSIEKLTYQIGRISGKLESEADKLSTHKNAKIRKLAERLDRLAVEAQDAYDGIKDRSDQTFDIECSIEEAKEALERAIAYVKTFKHDEFGTIYCEREWRSIDRYVFDLKHVAMVVLPKRAGKMNYFADFVKKQVRKLKIPSDVPVVPWEDLIDH
jgi:hypothetical protein